MNPIPHPSTTAGTPWRLPLGAIAVELERRAGWVKLAHVRHHSAAPLAIVWRPRWLLRQVLPRYLGRMEGGK